ncbi:hypothetical protein [Marinobacter sp. ATCH36]|uniref:hypothetical protein n=1 Tax=Marinobacter sp. ATCH36 TaxID=2945106 RepID=UPI002020CD6D|nr:hypothetical protein [Marinobacter sp. ATCH36]MCL7943784.1 hypothetical protein [Marinobacter sp. ATCH36]
MDLIRFRYSLALILALGVSGNVNAESSEGSSVESLKEETRELGQALKEFGADQKAEAEAAIESTLAALDKRIETLQQELDQNWDDMSEKARERSRKSLESLREQRERVQTWYDELQASSSSAWERAKKGFSDAYEALSEQWNDTERKLINESDKEKESI